MRTRLALLAITSLVAAGAAATGAAAPPDGSAPSDSSAPTVDCDALAQSATTPAELTTFVGLAMTPGTAVVFGGDPTTVLIPVNAAFDAIPATVLESITADPDLVKALVDVHVVAGEARSAAELADAGTVESALGAPLTFTLDGDTLVVNDTARVICEDVSLAGFTLQVIDSILRPPATSGVPGGVPGSSVPGSSVPAGPVPGLDADQQAVATAWETAVDSSLGFDDVAAFIENAGELRAVIEAYPAAGDVVGGVTATVTGVTIDGEAATVVYQLFFNGVDPGYPPQEATLALVDGEWIVPQDQYCAFQSLARNPVACPAS